MAGRKMSRASKLSLTLALSVACAGAAFAQSSAQSPGVSVSAVADAASDAASSAPHARRSSAANPLWAIPLENLRATRERPLFSAARRPPAPPVVAAAPVISAPPPPPAPPEKPDVTLVGVVHGEKEDIGIFINQMDQSVVRLRIGQDDHGWVVRSVDLRATTLEKESQLVKLELPARNATIPAGAEVAMIPAGTMVRSLPGRGPRPDR
jgi:general secretion pathway protein N